MAKEIERKFVIVNDAWKSDVINAFKIRQGYLNTDHERTVRVRIKNDKGYLTVKGKSEGITRLEFEYEIPFDEAAALMKLCEKNCIEKTRYEVFINNTIWEVDIFEGVNSGLEVAEVELNSHDQEFDLPNWIGEEVSMDAKYYNSNLIDTPYSKW